MEEGVQRDGSNLSGVSAMCRWEDTTGKSGEDHMTDHMTPEVSYVLVLVDLRALTG